MSYIVAQDAHIRREAIKEALRAGRKAFIQLAFYLAQAVEQEDYKVLDYERVEDYFMHEYNMKPSTAFNLVAIGRTFSDLNQQLLVECDYTRLVKLLPIVSNSPAQAKEEWVIKAAKLPPNAFDDEVRIAKGQIAFDECKHGMFSYYVQCGICGRRHRDIIGTQLLQQLKKYFDVLPPSVQETLKLYERFLPETPCEHVGINVCKFCGALISDDLK